MTTISVDKEVWSEITHRLRLGRDSRNKVLRRLLGLDQDGVIVVEGEVTVDQGELLTWGLIEGKTLYELLDKLFGGILPTSSKVRITIEKVE